MSMPGTPRTLFKAGADTRLYSFDYVRYAEFGTQNPAQTISLAVVSSAAFYVPTGVSAAALTLGTPAISGTQVQFTIAGGTATVVYRVSCVITTSGSAIITQDGFLTVA